MAKDFKISVNMVRPSFTETCELYDLIHEALEDRCLVNFEVVNSPLRKKEIIDFVEGLWVEAEKKANAPDAKQRCEHLKAMLSDYQQKYSSYNQQLKSASSFFSKVKATIALAKLYLKKVDAVDLIVYCKTMAPEKAAKTEKKVMHFLKKRIVTTDMLQMNFIPVEVANSRPSVWPETSANYFTVDEVPYLASLIGSAKLKGFEKNDLLEAWDKMMNKKAAKTVLPKGWYAVDLDEALLILFEPVSYHVAKKHFAAFLTCVESEDIL